MNALCVKSYFNFIHKIHKVGLEKRSLQLLFPSNPPYSGLVHKLICTTSVNNCSTESSKIKVSLKTGPSLEHFINNVPISTPGSTLSKRQQKFISHPYVSDIDLNGHGRKVYFEVYGCPMNVSDAEIAWSILQTHGFVKTTKVEDADVVLIVTCSIREGSENKIWNKLKKLSYLKSKRSRHKVPMKFGVLGCMAERLKSDLIERDRNVDIVAGPDSYRDLPRLLAIANNGESAVNVLLSLDETYATIIPTSLTDNRLSAFVSIMRGCDNMCTYCIVPFTRGRERSRSVKTILDEIRYLSDTGVKEVTLLGQNVNSYRDTSTSSDDDTNVLLQPSEPNLASGFKTIYKLKKGGLRFADLLDQISHIDPEMRIRFTSPHPKDFPNQVLQLIAERHNICNCLHLPIQAGSSRILDLMGRGYTKETYLQLVDNVRSIIPTVALTADIMCGFCSETEEEFEETLTVMRQVQYNFCYIFAYSMREKTKAHRSLVDDVSAEVKKDRHTRLINTFREEALKVNKRMIGETQIILVERPSKRSSEYLEGRNDGSTKVIIPDIKINTNNDLSRNASPGDYVKVVITDASSQVLHGTPIFISSLKELYNEIN